MYKLDDIDRQIINLLGNDARISLSEIGRELNLSHVTIRNRLINLFNNNFVKTQVLVNILKLNIEVVHLLIQTEGATSTRELIDRYKNCPRIIQISTILGQFDLIVTVFAEDKSQLETVLRACILRTSQGIRNSSILTVGRLVSPPYFPIKFIKPCESETPCGLKCSDCREYKLENCLGCPATSTYKGLFNVYLEQMNR
ncbi:MAG: Lrp/AsnC family transcriptional regulator [Promethearchaeota archaeon]